MKTDYSGVDKYIEDVIKNREVDMVFYNVKKAREIIKNIIITSW